MGDNQRRRGITRCAAALALAALLVTGCGDDTNPDPGAPGGETELDGGETDGNGSSTSVDGTGGTAGGATQGNQIAPGDTTTQTANQPGG